MKENRDRNNEETTYKRRKKREKTWKVLPIKQGKQSNKITEKASARRKVCNESVEYYQVKACKSKKVKKWGKKLRTISNIVRRSHAGEKWEKKDTDYSRTVKFAPEV